MAKHSITAVFDTRADAEKAVEQLESSGIPNSDVTILPAAGETGTYTDEAEGRTRGFWSSLEDLFGGTEDRATYAEGIRRGGVMVSVRAEDDRLDGVVDILERHGSVDLDERETSWRSEGWNGGSVAGSGFATGAAGSTDAAAARAATATAGVGTLGAGALGAGAGALGTSAYDERLATSTPVRETPERSALVTDRAVTDRATVPASTGGIANGLRGTGEDVVQVVEERLDVGKRSVSRGKVRVRTSIVTREVSEDVTLHGETVTVDRRTVDRPVSAAAFDADPFKERTIEVEEFAEEAVVAKSARVVEEIGIRKDATDRVETVHDTVRSTKVDIEDGRTGGAVGTAFGRFAEQVRDDMEVVGSDGEHVGVVDHLDGDRIKLKKNDAASGGTHHYLTHDMVQSVAGKVMLAVTAAEARARWAAA